MKQPKFYLRHLILTGVGAVVCTLLTVALLLNLLLGPKCLTLLEAWGMIQLKFAEEYDPDKAIDSALDGMVNGLGNRWSYYLNAQEYAAQTTRRNNSYVGVGITVNYTDPRGLLILSVQEGGSAAEAGIRPGEIITAVDGISLAGEGQEQGVELIQGEEGTTVKLTLLDSEGAERELEVTRKVIQNQSVSVCELLPGSVGYIRLANFYSNSASQLNAAVDDLVAQGAKALLFDMRENGGGYVHELTAMLDHLLPEGPIFRMQYKDGTEEVTESDEACVDLPMAVLVNADTYSAAEIFAAQLKESVGAGIIGEETSGKGNFQQAYQLRNGGALNISTGRYCTGGGVSLVGTGVDLDEELSLSGEDLAALQAGTLAYEEDEQLQKALEWLSEK